MLKKIVISAAIVLASVSFAEAGNKVKNVSNSSSTSTSSSDASASNRNSQSTSFNDRLQAGTPGSYSGTGKCGGYFGAGFVGGSLAAGWTCNAAVEEIELDTTARYLGRGAAAEQLCKFNRKAKQLAACASYQAGYYSAASNRAALRQKTTQTGYSTNYSTNKAAMANREYLRRKAAMAGK